jgi:hypothetical protein
MVILYPFSVQYVWKLDCWAHILWAFGLALKPGVAPCRVTLPYNRAKTSIESAPLPLATLLEPPDSHPSLLSKGHLNLGHSPHHSTVFPFFFSLARAQCHWNSTRHRCSLSPPFHAHLPSIQWHPWWWTSRPSFSTQIAYQHANSCKKIF